MDSHSGNIYGGVAWDHYAYIAFGVGIVKERGRFYPHPPYNASTHGMALDSQQSLAQN